MPKSKKELLMRDTKRDVTWVVEVRTKTGLSQTEFAKLLGVSVRTLQDWEPGRRQPSGAAKSLLKIAEKHPATLRELAA